MDRVTLLEALKAETQAVTADLLLPVQMQKDDTEQPADRAAKVYLMRVPSGSSATKKVPYILHQVITGKDEQPEGEEDEARTTVRSIFAVYDDDEERGGLSLLNLMERVRIHLLQEVIIGNQFELDKQAGLEILVYPDDTAPFYMGEMASVWKCPAIERNVRRYLT
ncbi:MAG: hypothetical protein NC131_08155 [Roseburia sp.]|nr:hypothetical protein [Roseburia sp.]